nr:hypothetical protein GCM10020093_105500 [Planobispora longispora]
MLFEVGAQGVHGQGEGLAELAQDGELVRVEGRVRLDADAHDRPAGLGPAGDRGDAPSASESGITFRQPSSESVNISVPAVLPSAIAASAVRESGEAALAVAAPCGAWRCTAG